MNDAPQTPAPGGLAGLLRDEKGPLLARWLHRVLHDPAVPEAQRLPMPALQDHIPALIDRLAECLESTACGARGHEHVGRWLGHQSDSEAHAHSRYVEGYALDAALRELSHLRAAIFDLCLAECIVPAPGETALVHATLDEAMGLVAREIARREQELLRAIVEQSSDGIIVTDARGNLVVVNHEAERQRGTGRRGVAPEHWPQEYGLLGMDGAPLPLAQSPLYRALHGERVVDARWQVRRPDGTVRTLVGTAAPLRRSDDTLAGAVLMSHDATERMRLERDLAAEKALLETVVRQMPAGVVIAEAPSERVVLGNAQGEQLLEQVAAQGASRTSSAEGVGLHPDGRRYAPEEWPLSRAIRNGETVASEEIEYARADGTRATFEARAVPVRGADGAIVAGVVVFIDVTSRKRAERGQRFLARASKALSESFDYEATLQHVAQLAVPDVADLCFVDTLAPDGNVRRVAVAYRDPRVAPFAQRLRREYHLEQNPHSHIARVMREGVTELVSELSNESIDEASRGADATLVPVIRALGATSYMIVPLRARGRTLGAVTLVATARERRFDAEDLALAEELALRAAVAVDNARLYRDAQQALATRAEMLAEQQRASLELARDAEFRERFMGVLGHDLRSPLGAVLFTADTLLRREDLPEAFARPIRRIAGSGRRMERMIADLLDLTRSRQGGGIPIVPRATDLTTVCRQVLDEVESTHAPRVVQFDARGEAHGEWDPDRVAQIVSNLVINALSYSPADTPVRVELRDEGDAVVISVHNEGAPIPAELVPRLFDPFRRAVQPASPQASQGLGLGLYIVREVARAHGGTVAVRSTVETGTAFTVRLPRAAVLTAKGA